MIITEEDRKWAIRNAMATLQDATNQVYNIEGDRWQMAYEVLEVLIANLEIEVDRDLI